MGQIQVTITATLETQEDFNHLSILGQRLANLELPKGTIENIEVVEPEVVQPEPVTEVAAPAVRPARRRTQKAATTEESVPGDQPLPPTPMDEEAPVEESAPTEESPKEEKLPCAPSDELPKELRAPAIEPVKPTDEVVKPAKANPETASSEETNPATYTSPKGITQAMIRQSLAEKAKKGDDTVLEIRRKLADFGARNVSGLPTQYFDEFYTFLQKV